MVPGFHLSNVVDDVTSEDPLALHGPVRAYAGSYRRARLEQWAATIRELAPQVDATFVYFNNDQNAYAPRNAATLRELLGV